jgi:ABC-type lipoprotein export system ATPase subunit
MLVELKNVSKLYDAPEAGQPLAVLQNVSLHIENGESVAIIGPSGSGKSTLLNLIGGLDTASSGQVLLGGRSLSSLSEKELATIRNREIGFIFQLHHLLPQCTVLENVLMPTLAGNGCSDDVEAHAEQLLKRVGLDARKHHRPGQLSGGECQRVAVVRSLINRPKLLLADEPTGALDRESADALGNLLVELNREQQVALVVVTHSIELARRMSRRLELSGGALRTPCDS